jgi:hypothetical protein
MSASAVQGKKVILKADKGNGYCGFYCAQTVAINFNIEQIESTSADSGNVAEFTPGITKYDVTLSGIMFLPDNSDPNWTALELLDHLSGGIPLQMIFENEFGSTTTFDFKGNVMNVSGSGIAGDIGKFSAHFQGSGPWSKALAYGSGKYFTNEFNSTFG